MLSHIWAVLTTRHSFRTFVFVHAVELLVLIAFTTVFYGATFIYSLLRWP